MSYTYKELTYTSSDGRNTVHAEMYIPEGEIRGIVQLSHGMIDYVGRYTSLAEYLTSQGYVFAGNDHLGHGRTAASAEDFGFFAERDGYKLVVDDLYEMNRLLAKEYPDVPIVLMGHSMGSFLARLYAAKYSDSISALIIHGTGGPNPLLVPGKMLAKLIKLFRGSRYRSKLINTLAFGSYNSKFPAEEGEHAWLTREISRVADRDTDPYTSFKFTLSAYCDLFTMLGESNSKAWFDTFPKAMPTLIISGEADPVGDYGKGVTCVYDRLRAAGAERLTMKLYPEARHELFNETNREEVFGYMGEWLKGALS